MRALDPNAGLVGGDDPGPAQRRNRLVALAREGALRPAQHGHQAALAERETEEVGERALQPLVGQSLEGLEISRHGMDAWPERCPLGGVRHGRGDPRSTRPAAHRQAPMLGDAGRHLRQLNLLVDADRLRRPIRHQDSRTARAPVRTVLDHLIGRGAEDPAVAFVTGLGSARFGALALLLAIGRGRL